MNETKKPKAASGMRSIPSRLRLLLVRPEWAAIRRQQLSAVSSRRFILVTYQPEVLDVRTVAFDIVNEGIPREGVTVRELVFAVQIGVVAVQVD